MSFEITGTLVKKYETETKGESFKVRDFVIKADDNGKYDNFVKFQTSQDRTAILDDYTEGQQVKVHFDLRGRQWQDKYFTNLNAWRVEAVGADPAKKATKQAPEELVAEDDDTPLPF
ncbi:hypothetical protein LEM8419_03499 [Neolewinella maritima]|uniref:DUF3127 domain-containing protein n=1 Tax=Neolewinella maritima TaxID=1383882 RepID=A0ABN8FE08_9BACT|nr:DUF3127 domain-containing protein [Neolewinella maritima]CAH1002627.1 hypothetical protein LEM8419_03499 [Neolewinella maritima]